jgi:hypothetical protein
MRVIVDAYSRLILDGAASYRSRQWAALAYITALPCRRSLRVIATLRDLRSGGGKMWWWMARSPAKVNEVWQRYAFGLYWATCM